MTKQQEIEVLNKAITALGPDSYLGPWLAEVRAEVESNIRSDFFPQVTLAESRIISKAITDDATARAEKIIEAAETKAAALVRDANHIRDNLGSAINAAQREINKW